MKVFGSSAGFVFRGYVFHSSLLVRTPFFVLTAVAAPMSFAVLRILGSFGAGLEPPKTLWFDSAVAGMWATTTTAVGILGFQRFQATLEHLVFSTRSPATVFGPVVGSAAVIGTVGVPIGIGLQVALGIPLGASFGLVVAAYFPAFLACCASACAMAAFFVRTRFATAYESVLLVPVWLLSGLVLPLAAFPAGVSQLAVVLPLTSAIEASRQTEWPATALWIGGSFMMSAFWLGIAGLALRWALRDARQRGTLSLS